jgi:hypothetical protein
MPVAGRAPSAACREREFDFLLLDKVEGDTLVWVTEDGLASCVCALNPLDKYFAAVVSREELEQVKLIVVRRDGTESCERRQKVLIWSEQDVLRMLAARCPGKQRSIT